MDKKVSFNDQLTDIYKICQLFYSKHSKYVEYEELCVIAEEALCMAIIGGLESRKTGPAGPRRHDNAELVATCRKAVKRALNRFIWRETKHAKRHYLTDKMN